jgi:hypothetical protein
MADSSAGPKGYWSAIVKPGQGEWSHHRVNLSRGVFSTREEAQAWLDEKGLAGYPKHYD